MLQGSGKIGLFEGDSPLPRGEGEDVHARKPRLFHNGERCLKILLRFAREADDDVRRDGGVGERLVNFAAGSEVFRAGVAAVHRAEHRVRPALQRKMKVRHEVALFHGKKQFVRDGALFHRAQTDAGGHLF